MISMNFAKLSPLSLPPGAEIRTYAHGDEALWVKLLDENGELGRWNIERAERAFTGPQRVLRESLHFLWYDGAPVATACVQRHDKWPDLPELGWVAVLPSHRGRGFGRIISLAVMHFMRRHGYERCFLRTSDRRLPAIRLYRKLGFTPDLESHPTFPRRWNAVFQKLNERSSDTTLA